MASRIRNQRSKRGNNKGARAVTRQAVRQMILARQEVKQYTANITAGNVLSASGQLVHLSPIALGDTISDRTGDCIMMKEIRLQLTAYMAAVASSTTFRVIVFTDSMGNGSILSITELLQTANFTSPYNAINKQRNRFKIYHDKSHTLVGGTPLQEVTDLVVIRPNVTRYFNDATGNQTNIGKNAPFLAVISSVSSGVFALQYSLRYTDS